MAQNTGKQYAPQKTITNNSNYWDVNYRILKGEGSKGGGGLGSFGELRLEWEPSPLTYQQLPTLRCSTYRMLKGGGMEGGGWICIPSAARSIPIPSIELPSSANSKGP